MDLVIFALIFFWIWLCSRFFLCPKLFLKNQGKNDFSKCQKNKYLCFLLHKFLKVWDIEKILNIAKFRKKSGQKWLSPNLTLRKDLCMDTPVISWFFQPHGTGKVSWSLSQYDAGKVGTPHSYPISLGYGKTTGWKTGKS